jgi:hypothetical protein
MAVNGFSEDVQQSPESPKSSQAFWFHKEVFIDLPHLGQISDIAIDAPDSRAIQRVFICGNRGAVILERAVSSSIDFEPPGHKVKCLGATLTSKVVGFYSRLPPHTVYNELGQHQWSYQVEADSISEMIAGDINGDGNNEFLIGIRRLRSPQDLQTSIAQGELALVDSTGKTRWRQSYPDIWHAELADLDGDKRAEILVSNYAGRVSIKDGSGATKQDISGYDARHFSLISWPTKGSPPHLLFSAKEHIWIVTAKGKLVAKFAALGAHEYEIRGTLVQMSAKEQPFLAVIVKLRAAVSNAGFYIFSSDGRLLHHERIPVLFPALSSMRATTGTTESLLVGGQGVVWRYSLSPSGNGK